MRVLLFGTFDEAAHPRTRVLREGLVERGVDVDVVNVPLPLSTADRVRLLERPAGLPRLVVALLRCWLGLLRGWWRLRRDAVVPDAVLVGYLGHFDVVLARLLFPRTLVVLDYLVSAADTARDRRARGRLRLAVLDGLDRLACRCADVVLVDTEESVATVPPPARAKAAAVPVGASSQWFAVPPDDRPPGPLRVVFYGLFTPLQGAPVLTAALAALVRTGTAVEATLVGDGQDRPAAEAAAPATGVTWVDWVAPAELPALVAAHDVCIGIVGATPKALRVVPNKAYQGAAAGCLVVTGDTPPQRRHLPPQTVFVSPGDPAALAAALASLPDPGGLLARRRESHAAALATIGPAACAGALLAAVERARQSRASAAKAP